MRISYDLHGFDFLAAGALVQKRAYTPGTRLLSYTLWSALFVALVTFFLALLRDLPILALTAGGGLIAIGAGCLIFNQKIRIRTNAMLAASPLMAGPSTLDLTPEGLAFENAHCRTLYRWSAVTAAFAHGEGLMVLFGAMSYLPLPVQAFADAAARDAVLAEIRARAHLKEN